eukprot:SAG31_NODE_35874_length_319_cov_0.495455_1_plen_74_part_10
MNFKAERQRQSYAYLSICRAKMRPDPSPGADRTIASSQDWRSPRCSQLCYQLTTNWSMDRTASTAVQVLPDSPN